MREFLRSLIWNSERPKKNLQVDTAQPGDEGAGLNNKWGAVSETFSLSISAEQGSL